MLVLKALITPQHFILLYTRIIIKEFLTKDAEQTLYVLLDFNLALVLQVAIDEGLELWHVIFLVIFLSLDDLIFSLLPKTEIHLFLIIEIRLFPDAS